MSHATESDHITFLLTCVKFSILGKVDFESVATATGMISRAAAGKRYSRLLKKYGDELALPTRADELDAVKKTQKRKRTKSISEDSRPTTASSTQPDLGSQPERNPMSGNEQDEQGVNENPNPDPQHWTPLPPAPPPACGNQPAMWQTAPYTGPGGYHEPLPPPSPHPPQNSHNFGYVGPQSAPGPHFDNYAGQTGPNFGYTGSAPGPQQVGNSFPLPEGVPFTDPAVSYGGGNFGYGAPPAGVNGLSTGNGAAWGNFAGLQDGWTINPAVLHRGNQAGPCGPAPKKKKSAGAPFPQ